MFSSLVVKSKFQAVKPANNGSDLAPSDFHTIVQLV